MYKDEKAEIKEAKVLIKQANKQMRKKEWRSALKTYNEAFSHLKLIETESGDKDSIESIKLNRWVWGQMGIAYQKLGEINEANTITP